MDMSCSCGGWLPPDVIALVMGSLRETKHLAKAGRVNTEWRKILGENPDHWRRCVPASLYYAPLHANSTPNFDWKNWLFMCHRSVGALREAKVEHDFKYPPAVGHEGPTATLGLGVGSDSPTKKCISSHKDHMVRSFDINTGQYVRSFEGHPRTPFCIKIHPSQPSTFASACYDGNVYVWDMETGVRKFQTQVATTVSSINFVPAQLAPSGADSLIITFGEEVHLWKYEVDAMSVRCELPLADEIGEQRPKVAMARFVKIPNRCNGTHRHVLFVAMWMNPTKKPPRATLVAYEFSEGEFKRTEIFFENITLFWEAGIAVSPNGELVAFCSLPPDRNDTLLTIMQLDTNDGKPTIMHSQPFENVLPGQQATSFDFSPCSSFLLVGFSYANPNDGSDVSQYPVAIVYRSKDCEVICTHRSDAEDNCSNGARFISTTSGLPGFLYGTVGGRVVKVDTSTHMSMQID